MITFFLIASNILHQIPAEAVYFKDIEKQFQKVFFRYIFYIFRSEVEIDEQCGRYNIDFFSMNLFNHLKIFLAYSNILFNQNLHGLIL